MNGYQITIITLSAISLLLGAYMHGKPKEGKHEFWVTLLGQILFMGLLYFGGFFK